ARRLLQEAGSSAGIIAKIERREALDALEEIMEAADAVMVARGDLAVEIGDPQLAGVQKEILRRARLHDCVVITATQMMASMVHAPTPTRAEVLDVANAILDGTDAVMLSEETAAGDHPARVDRKSTRLNSSHVKISYAVFCLKKKNNTVMARIEASNQSAAGL